MNSHLDRLMQFIQRFPDYWPAAVAAGGILLTAMPFYVALWYFLVRRKLEFPWRLRANFLAVFVLFAGLAFIFASPLADDVTPLLSAYLFVTCVVVAYCVVELLDLFFLQHYLINRRKIYISPPHSASLTKK